MHDLPPPPNTCMWMNMWIIIINIKLLIFKKNNTEQIILDNNEK